MSEKMSLKECADIVDTVASGISDIRYKMQYMGHDLSRVESYLRSLDDIIKARKKEDC